VANRNRWKFWNFTNLQGFNPLPNQLYASFTSGNHFAIGRSLKEMNWPNSVEGKFSASIPMAFYGSARLMAIMSVGKQTLFLTIQEMYFHWRRGQARSWRPTTESSDEWMMVIECLRSPNGKRAGKLKIMRDKWTSAGPWIRCGWDYPAWSQRSGQFYIFLCLCDLATGQTEPRLI